MLLKVNSITSELKNNISKTVDKLFKSDKVQSKNHVVLHNIYILYLIFVIALGDFLYLVYTGDLYSATIFILVGFLTYFFSKNMIVILFIALAITNIIKCGRCSEEGFEDGEGDADAEGEDKEKSKESMESESTEKPKKTEESQKPTPTTSVPTKTPTSTADEFSLSVENATNEKKEQFGQDTKVVYTSEEDREIQKTEKMMVTQEKMLKSMNKYKPLLDTLNGLTRNIAAVKGTTDSLTKDTA
jgi:hypothetical protein